MRTLYGIQQSPWTERARWALDHHALPYRYHEHVPLVGELLLRRKARAAGRASVPLLVDRGETFRSSTEIARYADRVGRGSPLFPRGADVARWDDLAEGMAKVGRALLLRNMRASDEARRESLPGFVPRPLRGVLAPSADLALSFLAKKHDVSADPDGEVERTLRPALAAIRAELGGRPYLLEGFSWADVAVATALQCVRPHARAPFGPATRAAWTHEALAREFDDLLMWRDAVYARHR